MGNLNKEIWEGWTPQDFIAALYDEIYTIMTGKSWRKPFESKKEMIDYIAEHQPYYKKPIDEVNEYFCELYGMKG